MPWPVKELLSVRLEFVTLADQPGANIRQLCRRFGVSPTAGYKWLERYRAAGAQGLRDLGHRSLPAISTITDILRRRGLIKSERSQATEPWQRFERAAPNELWQVDFKGPFALKAGRCHTLCAIDDHSRYNVLLQACPDQQEGTVQERLIEAFRCHGLPDALLWDNGSPWGSGPDSDFTALEVWLLRLGVRAYHGRPYHPQTQGKEERFHRTLQAEVLYRGGWNDCCHVQRAFDDWRPIYNSQRPHEALDQNTPVTRYRPSQRSYPEQMPTIEYDTGVHLRRVDAAGRISYRGRPWKIGKAFVGQVIGLRPSPHHGFIEVIYLTHLIRLLDLHNHQSLRPIAANSAS